MLKLNGNSLDWALNNINIYGDTNIFPKPFEFEAINENWSDVKNYLSNINVYSEGIRQYRTAVTPKSRLGFRISTQLDPLDAIIYNAILFEINEDIEKARLPKELEVVYSFRLSPNSDGTLYDNQFNWDSFNKKAEEYVLSEKFAYVVVTDIADFYHSIYLHYVETILRECVVKSGKASHAETLINIVKAMYIKQTHKGLPVGPQFSRVVAELILDEVDRVLLDEGFTFIRYVDDYRIFCNYEDEAYEKLIFLAQTLYDLRNLKLNENKTHILGLDKFTQVYLITPKERVEESGINRFYELVEELGISLNPYVDIDFDSFDEEDIKKLQELNLVKLLKEELDNEKVNFGSINILLGNLARMDNTQAAEIVLNENNFIKLFPILKSIINYLKRVKSFTIEQKHEIGREVIELMENSFVGKLNFNRMWLLNLFASDEVWGNEGKFIELMKLYKDDMTQRELMLALGRSKNIRYFRVTKSREMVSNIWSKRAYIAAISCLPKSERDPWYKARELTNRDILEQFVEKWASCNNL